MHCKIIRWIINKVTHEITNQTVLLKALISLNSAARSLIHHQQLWLKDKSHRKRHWEMELQLQWDLKGKEIIQGYKAVVIGTLRSEQAYKVRPQWLHITKILVGSQVNQ